MRTMKITFEQAKEKVLNTIISCEIGSYMTNYAPDKAVITISNIMSLTGLTRYGARKALKALQQEGLVYYTSQGCPAVVSYGEYTELVCEAGPPINGYALTKEGFRSRQWLDAYESWNKSMGEWANGGCE